MNRQYDEEFKEEVVGKYLKGIAPNTLFTTYGIPKSTLNGWIKKYSEECHYTKPQNKENNVSVEELRALNKKIAELEKENSFLK